jgi:Ca2+-binding EF-hand superfamily protein
MSVISNKTGFAVCLVAALMVAHAAAAQTRVATNAPTATTQPQQTAASDAMFARWDKDANKVLSLDEFKAGWQGVQAAMALRKLHDNFVSMDANRNGSLDATEYATLELIRKAGGSAPSMLAFDADKNRALDFREYVALVQSMLKNPR